MLMAWELWLSLVAVALLGYAVWGKYRGGGNWFKVHVKRRVIQFASPHRVELILIALFLTFGLWFDIVQNQIISYGFGHRVTWFGNVSTSAFDLAMVMLFAFHIVLVTLFVRSLRSKDTSAVFDMIVGTLALFGVAIMLSGFFNDAYGKMVTLFGFTLSAVSYYHVGIAIEGLTVMYYAFTK